MADDIFAPEHPQMLTRAEIATAIYTFGETIFRSNRFELYLLSSLHHKADG